MKKLFRTKERQRYDIMHSRHSKELVKLAKETHEYDYTWLHESVIMQIKHMYEYYSAGDNVWQADETRLPIVEQLQHVLDLNKELEHAIDEYSDKEPELYKEIYSYIGEHIMKWWD